MRLTVLYQIFVIYNRINESSITLTGIIKSILVDNSMRIVICPAHLLCILRNLYKILNILKFMVV